MARAGAKPAPLAQSYRKTPLLLKPPKRSVSRSLPSALHIGATSTLCVLIYAIINSAVTLKLGPQARWTKLVNQGTMMSMVTVTILAMPCLGKSMTKGVQRILGVMAGGWLFYALFAACQLWWFLALCLAAWAFVLVAASFALTGKQYLFPVALVTAFIVATNFNTVEQAFTMTAVKTVAISGTIVLYTLISLVIFPLTATQQLVGALSDALLALQQLAEALLLSSEAQGAATAAAAGGAGAATAAAKDIELGAGAATPAKPASRGEQPAPAVDAVAAANSRAASLAAQASQSLQVVQQLLPSAKNERYVGRVACLRCFVPAARRGLDEGAVMGVTFAASQVLRALMAILAEFGATPLADRAPPAGLVGPEAASLLRPMAEQATAALQELASALPPGGPVVSAVRGCSLAAFGGSLKQLIELTLDAQHQHLHEAQPAAGAAPGGAGAPAVAAGPAGKWQRTAAAATGGRVPGAERSAEQVAAAFGRLLADAVSSNEARATRWCTLLVLSRQLGKSTWGLTNALNELLPVLPGAPVAVELPPPPSGQLLLLAAGAALLAAADAVTTSLIPLPDGIRPEGVAAGGSNDLWVACLSGAVVHVDLATNTSTVVHRQAGVALSGAKFDAAQSALFAAGSLSGSGYVFHVARGASGAWTVARVEAVQLGTPLLSYINDVALSDDRAYFTDSFSATLWSVPRASPPPGGAPRAVQAHHLGAAFATQLGQFRANGAAVYASGGGEDVLLLANTHTGHLYRAAVPKAPPHAPAVVTELALPPAPPGSTSKQLLLDGVAVAGPGLAFVADNYNNRVWGVALGPGAGGAAVRCLLDPPTLGVPTTLALVGRTLWAVNAHLDSCFPFFPCPKHAFELLRCLLLAAALAASLQAAAGSRGGLDALPGLPQPTSAQLERLVATSADLLAARAAARNDTALAEFARVLGAAAEPGCSRCADFFHAVAHVRALGKAVRALVEANVNDTHFPVVRRAYLAAVWLLQRSRMFAWQTTHLEADSLATMFKLYAHHVRRAQGRAISLHHISKCGGTTLCQLAATNKCANPHLDIEKNCVVDDRLDSPVWMVAHAVNASGAFPDPALGRLDAAPPGVIDRAAYNKNEPATEPPGLPMWLMYACPHALNGRLYDCASRGLDVRRTGTTFLANERALPHELPRSAVGARSLGKAHLCPGFTNAIMLRRPVPHVISLLAEVKFRYVRQLEIKNITSWTPPGWNLTWWEALGPALVGNYATRSLLGREAFCRSAANMGPEQLRDAAAALLGFDLVMTLDRPADIDGLVAALLGWPARTFSDQPAKRVRDMLPRPPVSVSGSSESSSGGGGGGGGGSSSSDVDEDGGEAGWDDDDDDDDGGGGGLGPAASSAAAEDYDSYARAADEAAALGLGFLAWPPPPELPPEVREARAAAELARVSWLEREARGRGFWNASAALAARALERPRASALRGRSAHGAHRLLVAAAGAAARGGGGEEWHAFPHHGFAFTSADMARLEALTALDAQLYELADLLLTLDAAWLRALRGSAPLRRRLDGAAATYSGCGFAGIVLNNPAPFTDPIVLEVQYECLSALAEDLEWRLNYVGSAESDAHDQILDSALVGPVQQGHFKFRMEAPAPDPSKIPASDLLGVTALLLTCSYKGKEFVRVGYYVNVEYTDPELLDPERPLPNPPLLSKLQRSIMADHPRVTKFPHDFDNAPPPMPEADAGEPPEDDLLPDEEPDDGEEEEEDDDDDEELGDDGTGEEALLADEVENVNPAGHQVYGYGYGCGQASGKLVEAAAEDMDTDMRLG
ncbi:ASF1B [Scenedesmus sp. PABB004]|nr:ASF1B [Scenedesmus sp. PABB004]